MTMQRRVKDTLAVNTYRKRSVSDACRLAVAELEQWGLWAYRDTSGGEWDAQPACFITDYILGIQCILFAAYLGLFDVNWEERTDAVAELMQWSSDFRISGKWYVIYFAALGISATVGGILHHIAYEALQSMSNAKIASLLHTPRVFGMQMKRTFVDKFIGIAWRIVLACSIITNFSLVAIVASRYLSESWAFKIILITAACYALLMICAVTRKHSLFLLIGYVPVLIFGSIASLKAFNWQWMSAPSHEMLVYGLKLTSGLIQGLVLSPCRQSFNHNALAHVILSVAATFMFLIHVQL